MPKTYHKNPRQITAQQYGDLDRWLAEFGDLSGIVHDLNSDEIIGGNQRSRVFGVEGRALVDLIKSSKVVLTETFDTPTAAGTVALGYVYWKDEKYSYRQVRWTEEQCERANIIANKAGGTWDFDVLANEFDVSTILASGFAQGELVGFDFGPEDNRDADTDIEQGNDLREKWGVQLGDLWQLGDHRLLCGDSTEDRVVSRLMNGEKAVLMNTDPPYGDSWVAKAKDMRAHGYGHSRAGLHRSIENDDLSDSDLSEFICAFLETAKLAGDAPMPTYVWHRAKRIIFEQALIRSGWFVHQPVMWVKPSFVIGRLHYHPRAEWALHGWRQGNGKCPFYGERNQSDVWEIDRENAKIHPTQKPIELFAIPMRNHTKPGEICYEPFSGSGSQIIAGQNLGRRVYAIELSPVYLAVTLQRFKDAFGITPTLYSRETQAEPSKSTNE